MARPVKGGSSKAVEFCRARGIQVVPGECPFMFLRNGGFIRKITGSYPRRFDARTGWELSGENPHEPGRVQIGRQKSPLLSRGAPQRFRRQISATHCTFHGRGPAGCCPISGKKDARPSGGGVGTVAVDSRARGIGSVEFFDDGRLYEIGFTSGWEEFADLTEGEVDDLGAGFIDE